MRTDERRPTHKWQPHVSFVVVVQSVGVCVCVCACGNECTLDGQQHQRTGRHRHQTTQLIITDTLRARGFGGHKLSDRTTIVLIYETSALLTEHVHTLGQAAAVRTYSAFHLLRCATRGERARCPCASVKPNPNRQYKANTRARPRVHCK